MSVFFLGHFSWCGVSTHGDGDLHPHIGLWQRWTLTLSTGTNQTDSWGHILLDIMDSKHCLAGKLNQTIISFLPNFYSFVQMRRAGSHFEVTHA